MQTFSKHLVSSGNRPNCEKIMGIGHKIVAGIALAVAAMVVRRYMKKRGEEERGRNGSDI
jgi:hypothetical protein